MFEFLKLVQNENMKIYRRVRTWVMFAIMLAIPLAMSVIGLLYGEDPDMWAYARSEALAVLTLMSIFAVVIAADSVAGEFSSGTIKLLLIRPWSRSKILLSKYLALALFMLLSMALLFVFTLLLNLALFGSGGDYTFPNQGSMSHFAYLAAFYGLSLIEMVVTVTMAFMISTVFRSGSLAIGLSIFVLLGGQIIASLLEWLDKPWVDYILFLHFGLQRHLAGYPMIADRTLGFSLGVLAGYYVIFMALSWYVFNRRDVAA